MYDSNCLGEFLYVNYSYKKNYWKFLSLTLNVFINLQKKHILKLCGHLEHGLCMMAKVL